MAEPIRVSPAELLTAGAQVEGQATEVEACHAAADARIQAAQPGLVGLSAIAVEAKLGQWQATTKLLCARLTDHAAAFHASAIGFHEREIHNRQSVADLGTAAQASGSALEA